MFNMIKADIYKLIRSKGFYIYLVLMAITYSITLISKMPGGMTLGMIPEFPEGTKLDVRMEAFNFTLYFLFIMPVFMVLLSDFSEKTIKNTISSAISREKYYITKALFIELFITVSHLGVNALFYALNSLKNGEKYTSPFSDFYKVTLMQLPVFLFIGALFILLAVVLKRAAQFNALTIIAPIVYTTAELTMYGLKATHDFSEKYLLKSDLSYMLAQFACGCSDSYRNTCYMITGIGTALALLLGYRIFSKGEIS